MSGEGGSEGGGREEREGKEEMEGEEKEGPGRKEGRGRSRAGPRTVVGARSAQIAPPGPAQGPDASAERFDCGAGSALSLRPYPGIFTFTLRE